MRVLVDSELNTSLGGAQPIVTGIPQLDNGLGPRTQVQAASFTFTIGDIFVPGTKPDELGGSRNARDSYNLQQGRTAVIRTREQIHLGPRHVAIGFPPAFQSLRGLLMTNPGHIDPGYDGPLHCTVINMAHESFFLESGQHIMRVLIFQLGPAETEPQAPYNVRNNLAAGVVRPSPVTEQLLDRLSIDFVDVDKRAADAAEKQVSKAQLAASRLPLITAVITGLLTLAGSYYLNAITLKDDVEKLRNELTQTRSNLEAADKLNKLGADFANLGYQVSLSKTEDRIRKLEEALATRTPAPQQNRAP